MTDLTPQEWEEKERKKYENVWGNFPQYRRWSPGESRAMQAHECFGSPKRASIVDYGVGPGRAAAIFDKLGYLVTGIDIAKNCLDPANQHINLKVRSLWNMEVTYSDYGFCCDVMEHIPEQFVPQVLRNIRLGVAKKAFFNIHMGVDGFGKHVGDELHLTMKPKEWWLDKMYAAGFLVDKSIEERNLTFSAVFSTR